MVTLSGYELQDGMIVRVADLSSRSIERPTYQEEAFCRISQVGIQRYRSIEDIVTLVARYPNGEVKRRVWYASTQWVMQRGTTRKGRVSAQ